MEFALGVVVFTSIIIMLVLVIIRGRSFLVGSALVTIFVDFEIDPPFDKEWQRLRRYPQVVYEHYLEHHPDPEDCEF